MHKDIKPDNILFTEKFDVKLIDFGVAEYSNYSEEYLKYDEDECNIAPIPSRVKLEGTKMFLSPECWNESYQTSENY